MFEFDDAKPDPQVQDAEYLRLLGFPRHHDIGERSRELMAWARAWYSVHGRPWIFARPAGGLEIAGARVRIGEAEFSSNRFRTMLLAAEAHDAVLVAVSAGKECEDTARQCWQEGKPDEYFFLESYASAVVEDLVTQAAKRICAWADGQRIAVLPHYSPGYSGWPVSDQPRLWQILRPNQGQALPGELEVLDTGMLRPKKSLLTVFGLTRNLEKVGSGTHLIPCENCALPKCRYRRAEYKFR